MANVGANEFRISAERAKLGDQRLTGIIAATGDDETVAFLCKRQRGGTADAGQRAGRWEKDFLGSKPYFSGMACLHGGGQTQAQSAN
jgi:hypothetical protein